MNGENKQPDERALFEAWLPALDSDPTLTKGEDGYYIDWDVHRAWAAWQARAASQATPTGERAAKLAQALTWALDWIDAVPDSAALPTMPGFDRDYVNALLEGAGAQPRECARDADEWWNAGAYCRVTPHASRRGWEGAAKFGYAEGVRAASQATVKDDEYGEGWHDGVRSEQAAQKARTAAPQAGALTDEQIDATWDAIDGTKIISGSDCAEWNRQIRRAFARALLAAAQGGKGEQPREA